MTRPESALSLLARGTLAALRPPARLPRLPACFSLLAAANLSLLEGENLDLALDRTVSQPPSSCSSTAASPDLSWLAVDTFSTDLGVFRPLTVSAQLLQDPVELMDDEEPKGKEFLPELVDAALDTVVEGATVLVVGLRGAVDALVTTALAGRVLPEGLWAL